jgi:hypothetical protein
LSLLKQNSADANRREATRIKNVRLLFAEEMQFAR